MGGIRIFAYLNQYRLCQALFLGAIGKKMDEPSSDLRNLLANGVRASGFPFQAKIQHLLESLPKWSVVGSECSWSHEGKEGFLDIVASQGDLYLAIECKRVGVVTTTEPSRNRGITAYDGAPKKSFVFLCQHNEFERNEETTRTVVTRFLDEADVAGDPFSEIGVSSEERRFKPSSHEASLCVTIDVHNRRQLLEGEISELVRGTHQYANEKYSFLWRVGGFIHELFLPVLVTTAPLFVLNYDPDDVSVDDGEFSFSPEDIHPVRWIRFKKQFMAGANWESTERTVLVVQAKYFVEFLTEFEAVSKHSA